MSYEISQFWNPQILNPYIGADCVTISLQWQHLIVHICLLNPANSEILCRTLDCVCVACDCKVERLIDRLDLTSLAAASATVATDNEPLPSNGQLPSNRQLPGYSHCYV